MIGGSGCVYQGAGLDRARRLEPVQELMLHPGGSPEERP